MKQQAKGFTLIETMIAVAIVGILAAIAYPSYSDSVRKGRRAEAINTLSAIALAQEKWRANNAAYGFVSACATPVAGCWRIVGTVALVSSAAATTEGGYYSLANAPASTATTFSTTATAPTGSNQAADKANGTSCSALTINQSGPDTTTVGADSKTKAACWNRS